MMDDFSVVDGRLTGALDQLRSANRFLGGFRPILHGIHAYVQQYPGEELQLLDVGTGIADIPERLVRWFSVRHIPATITCIDANSETVRYAGEALDRRLPPELRRRVHVMQADVFALPFEEKSFDVCMASLFLHHFDREDAVKVLRTLGRLARRLVIVNDLHRHPLAYCGILSIVKVLPVSEMFEHDGPLSVLRGFKRGELVDVVEEAGLHLADISWHWAFRWSVVAEPLYTPVHEGNPVG